MALRENPKLRKGILCFVCLAIAVCLVFLAISHVASNSLREKIAADVFSSARQLYQLSGDVEYGCQDPYYMDQANLLEYQTELLREMNFKYSDNLGWVVYYTQRVLSMIQREEMDSEAARQYLAQVSKYYEFLIFDAQGNENKTAGQLRDGLKRLSDHISSSDDFWELQQSIEKLRE